MLQLHSATAPYSCPQGRTWCLSKSNGGVPCSQIQEVLIVDPFHGPPPRGPTNYSISNIGWDNQQYASGPWPHSRYVNGGSGTWTADFSKVGADDAAKLRLSPSIHLPCTYSPRRRSWLRTTRASKTTTW